MKTTHLTALTAQLNPFSATSKVPRLILSRLPPAAHKTLQIKATQLPRASTLPATLELAFKDGKTMRWEWAEQAAGTGGEEKKKSAGVDDVVAEVERHSRILGRKEELAG